MTIHNHYLAIEPEKIDKIIKDQGVRRALTKACHFWFFYIYFPHYIKYKSARFHKELFEITEDETQKTVVIEAFRGSGKTTIMGTSYAIWSILGCQQRKFVLIIAKTESQARQYLANIKAELESNGLLRADLGPFEEPNDEWRAVSIVLPKYGARIMVASIESSIRGIKHGPHRPQLIICDDLEDLDIVKTQESRDKMFQWLMGDIIPLGEKDTRLIVIGTRLHNDSIITRLKNAILTGTMRGIARAYPFLDDDDKPLWQDKYTTEAEVETLRKSLPSTQAWEREYMLRIIADDDQVVRPEWIQSYETLPQDDAANFRYAASGVDPAISEKETADYTAMVSGRVYGRNKTLKIYILPNPVNERMDFPKTIATVKAVSKTLGNGSSTQVFVEGVAYQKALIDQLKADDFPAKEWKPQGSDKRARLSLVSNLIQSGKVVFPVNGAERLISQITGFGTERHDDLSDAFCILVQSILERESRTIKGYYPLFSEKLLEESYSTKIPFLGEKRLGVVLAGAARTHSTIILRAENAADVLFCEPTDDVTLVANRTIEFAKQYDIPIANEYIFVDKVGKGLELCDRIEAYAIGQFAVDTYEYRQDYGIDMSDELHYASDQYADTRARSYWRLMEWLQKGGKLFSRPVFDDLSWIAYAEKMGRAKIIDKEKLAEEGIDSSIPDALVLTMVTEKNSFDPFIEPEDPPRYPEIGI
jgi:predicted phage terminase large subunit-like protein